LIERPSWKELLVLHLRLHRLLVWLQRLVLLVLLMLEWWLPVVLVVLMLVVLMWKLGR